MEEFREEPEGDDWSAVPNGDFVRFPSPDFSSIDANMNGFEDMRSVHSGDGLASRRYSGVSSSSSSGSFSTWSQRNTEHNETKIRSTVIGGGRSINGDFEKLQLNTTLQKKSPSVRETSLYDRLRMNDNDSLGRCQKSHASDSKLIDRCQKSYASDSKLIDRCPQSNPSDQIVTNTSIDAEHIEELTDDLDFPPLPPPELLQSISHNRSSNALDSIIENHVSGVAQYVNLAGRNCTGSESASRICTGNESESHLSKTEDNRSSDEEIIRQQSHRSCNDGSIVSSSPAHMKQVQYQSSPVSPALAPFPPRRNPTTKLSFRQERPQASNIIMDLDRVVTQKLEKGANGLTSIEVPLPSFPTRFMGNEDWDPNVDMNDLPPPPRELLAGLTLRRKSTGPAPPPKSQTKR